MAAVTLGGYFGFHNAGDDLILHAHLQRLQRTDPHRSLIVLSCQPHVTIKDFQVSAVQRWNPFACLLAFYRSDTFILAGGGLLQESSGPLNHLYYLSLVLAAKIMRCRTELHAMGVDAIRRSMNRIWTRWVLNHAADMISVRDQKSQRVLADLGIQQMVSVVPDPVFSLGVSPGGASSLRFAVALSGPETSHISALQSHFQILSTAYTCPIDAMIFFPDQDEATALELQKAGGGISRVRTPQPATELLSWIPEYSFVIGSRFHALVLAASAGIPFMGWGTQEKVQNLCQERGMPYIQNPAGVSPEELLSAVRKIVPLRGFSDGNKSDILAAQTD